MRPDRDAVRAAVARDRLDDGPWLPAGDPGCRGAEQQRHVDLEQRPARVPIRPERDVDVVLGELAGDRHLPRRPDERVLVEDDALRPPRRSAGREDEARSARIPRALVDLRPGSGGVLERAVGEEDRTRSDFGTHRVERVLPAVALDQVALEDDATGADLLERVERQRWRDPRHWRNPTPAIDPATLRTTPCHGIRQHGEDELARRDAAFRDRPGHASRGSPQLAVRQRVGPGHRRPVGIALGPASNDLGERSVLPVPEAPVLVLTRRAAADGGSGTFRSGARRGKLI